MGMIQAIRCKFGHHDWGPITGGIEHTRDECDQCGKVKPVRGTPQRGYGGPHGSESGSYGGPSGSESPLRTLQRIDQARVDRGARPTATFSDEWKRYFPGR